MWRNLHVYQQISHGTSRIYLKSTHNTEKSDVTVPLPNNDELITLMEKLLDKKEFRFNGHLYKRKLGTSMGAVPSPEVCDLRLFDILENKINKYHHNIKIVGDFRYRDDGVMLVNAKERQIMQLFLINLQKVCTISSHFLSIFIVRRLCSC